jgi:NAD(P)-dependent dehydrogenase (short-subunit alcohol dehydrogenase family)
MGRLNGKIVLMTGAASGIGRASAIACAREGAKVMLTDVDDEGGEKAAAEITQSGGAAAYMNQDVTNEDRWDVVIETLQSQFGALTTTVNNAGIAVGGPIESYSLEDWRRQFAVNVESVFLGTRASVRAMRAAGEGGSIINLSSIAGLVGSVGLSAYSSTKGAVRLFSKSIAKECGRMGDRIRVNSIHPGIIDTPIYEKEITRSTEVGGRERSNAINVNDILPNIPYGTIGVSDDIAQGVVYLASDESGYVTGSELVIDGGFTS